MTNNEMKNKFNEKSALFVSQAQTVRVTGDSLAKKNLATLSV